MQLDPLFLLSFAAGATCAASTAPENIATLLGRRRGKADGLGPRLRIARNAALSFGNGLWFAYGTLTGQLAIQIFCGISCLLAGGLALQQFDEFRHPDATEGEDP
ncbi:MAG: hypothetical protein HC794_00185 [Nitrospiraceae bacterium]|nr:hypothetical protein [Nitrospiraceae bacterium]